MHIYWFKDSITGHLKQVEALISELAKNLEFTLTSIDCSNIDKASRNRESIFADQLKLNQSILLLGAGHNVFSKILQSKKYLVENFNVKIAAIAILKPSYKLRSFDLICAPKHDFNLRKLPSNVLTFLGSLSSVSYSPINESKAIIAIGGKSKHYKLNKKILMKQLHFILSMHPNYDFMIFNSRRTPDDVNALIQNELNEYSNSRFIDLNSSESETFQKCLHESALKFVTPDSSNLVFESLSSYGKTFLIQIEDPKYRRIFGTKKIRNAMNELVQSKIAGVVSILQKKGGVNISKIEKPLQNQEPLAEVEKVAFSIIKYLEAQE